MGNVLCLDNNYFAVWRCSAAVYLFPVLIMKKFILNISIFFSVAIILGQIPLFFISPYYGNEIYNEKYNFFYNNSKDYNTIFIGSSRLYRHVDPKQLDH